MLGWSYPIDKHTPGGMEPFYCPMGSAGRSVSWSNPGQPPLALVPGCDVGSFLPSVPKMVKASPPKKVFPAFQLHLNCKVLLRSSACWAAKLCPGALLNFRGEKMSNSLGVQSTNCLCGDTLRLWCLFQCFVLNPISIPNRKKISVEFLFLLNRFASSPLAVPDSHPTKPVVYGAAPV